MYQGTMFTIKHVTYQVRVCLRDLLVCQHFPVLGTPHVSGSKATCRMIQ